MDNKKENVTGTFSFLSRLDSGLGSLELKFE